MCVSVLCEQNPEEQQSSPEVCPGERAFEHTAVLRPSAWRVRFDWKVRSTVIWRQCVVTLGMTQASTKGSLSLRKELEESELVSQLLQE